MRAALISLALVAGAAAFAPSSRIARRAVADSVCPDAIKALAGCAKQASSDCACGPEYYTAINHCSSTPSTSDALIDLNIEIQNLENVPSGIFTDDVNAIFGYTNRCPRDTQSMSACTGMTDNYRYCFSLHGSYACCGQIQGEVKLCAGLVPDTWWGEHVARAYEAKCPGFDVRMCEAAGNRVRRCLADPTLNCCAIKNHYDAYCSVRKAGENGAQLPPTPLSEAESADFEARTACCNSGGGCPGTTGGPSGGGNGGSSGGGNGGSSGGGNGGSSGGGNGPSGTDCNPARVIPGLFVNSGGQWITTNPSYAEPGSQPFAVDGYSRSLYYASWSRVPANAQPQDPGCPIQPPQAP